MYVWKRGMVVIFLSVFADPACLLATAVIMENLRRLTCAILTDGRKERVQFDKITARVSRLCYGLDSEHVDAATITQKVISGVYQGVTTVELDNLVSPQFMT